MLSGQERERRLIKTIDPDTGFPEEVVATRGRALHQEEGEGGGGGYSSDRSDGSFDSFDGVVVDFDAAGNVVWDAGTATPPDPPTSLPRAREARSQKWAGPPPFSSSFSLCGSEISQSHASLPPLLTQGFDSSVAFSIDAAASPGVATSDGVLAKILRASTASSTQKEQEKKKSRRKKRAGPWSSRVGSTSRSVSQLLRGEEGQGGMTLTMGTMGRSGFSGTTDPLTGSKFGFRVGEATSLQQKERQERRRRARMRRQLKEREGGGRVRDNSTCTERWVGEGSWAFIGPVRGVLVELLRWSQLYPMIWGEMMWRVRTGKRLRRYSSLAERMAIYPLVFPSLFIICLRSICIAPILLSPRSPSSSSCPCVRGVLLRSFFMLFAAPPGSV